MGLSASAILYHQVIAAAGVYPGSQNTSCSGKCSLTRSVRQKDVFTSKAAGHLNFARGSYLESTSRPIYALVFLLPLVIIYELGTFLVNTDHIAHIQSRVAAFTWLTALAQWLGMQRSLAWAFPGLVVVIILLCWHLSTDHPWGIKFRWLGWMALESMVLSLPLLLLNAVMGSSAGSIWHTPTAAAANLAPLNSSSYTAQVITSIGAGIYEELVFRLIIMGLILVVLEDLLKLKKYYAMFLSVMLSAVLFSLHHHFGIRTDSFYSLEDFEIVRFIFRTLAGIYFAFIFYYRGYGITAGTHAAYNMVVFALT